jgi:polysaccharide deacetylase family protein (PEP-CTERM system associated)
MNILTFDIEEWYVEKTFGKGRSDRYQQFDETLAKVLDELDNLEIKATFFCVGQLAVGFPEVIKRITAKGHEIGCHSNVHTWLDKMTPEELRTDTTEALKALEDVSGQKVVSYRAPAFSITPKNKWALPVLAECGIKNDASIFPTNRDFGGYKGFPLDTPCIISYEGVTLKEFPISLTSIMGKKIAYSGGGYFRSLPYWFVSRIMNHRDYNICYFHLSDMIHRKYKMLSRKDYENYFKESGTFKNRLVRYVKSSAGRGDVYGKLVKLLSNETFANVEMAENAIDWGKMNIIKL